MRKNNGAVQTTIHVLRIIFSAVISKKQHQIDLFTVSTTTPTYDSESYMPYLGQQCSFKSIGVLCQNYTTIIAQFYYSQVMFSLALPLSLVKLPSNARRKDSIFEVKSL